MLGRKKTWIKITSLLVAGVVFFVGPQAVQADEFDDQIAVLNQNVAGYNKEIDGLKRQQDTLNNQLAIINAQVNSILAQIKLSQAQYDQTVAELEAAQQKLTRQKEILGENIKVIYQQSQVSTLEMLVSSQSVGDFLDRQQYLEDVKEKVQDTVVEIGALKLKLEADQKRLSQLISEQKSLQYGLNQQYATSNNLLVETQGVEANYQARASADKKKITELQAAQAAAIAARSRRVRPPGGSGCGGYPAVWCNAPKDAYVDDWGFYTRECTSYAAWKRSAIGRPIPAWGRMGPADAKTWVDWGRRSGYRVDRTPEVGAIGVFTEGFYGHVMIVEQIIGSTVRVSNFNADFQGHYSVDDWPVSQLWFIH